jgi:hypothetical protein
MEIEEIIEIFPRELDVEVHFRMVNDDDEYIRIDEFTFEEIEEYGYDIFEDNSESFIYEEDDDEDEIDLRFLDQDINQSELISFMTEYYLVTEDIPNPELY